MSTIMNLMIPCIEAEYTAEYIANVFWNQNIAQVSRITLIPYLEDTNIYQIAYIDIANWCDSEIAYNFLQRLINPTKEVRLVHKSDDWWPVKMNTHNSGNLNMYTYSTNFNSSYFTRNLDDIEMNMKEIYYQEENQVDLENQLEKQDFESMLDRAVNNSKHVTFRSDRLTKCYDDSRMNYENELCL